MSMSGAAFGLTNLSVLLSLPAVFLRAEAAVMKQNLSTHYNGKGPTTA